MHTLLPILCVRFLGNAMDVVKCRYTTHVWGDKCVMPSEICQAHMIQLIVIFGCCNVLSQRYSVVFQKITIGIHSGEVVTGVIGNRMPRYCLFGKLSRLDSGQNYEFTPTEKGKRTRPNIRVNALSCFSL